jgi:hypothetical protein
MKKSVELLKDHPINKERIKAGKNPASSLWFWGEGTKPALENFEQKFGVKGGMISAVDLLKGIAKINGMRVIEVEGATGNYDTNFIGKAKACVDALNDGIDFVYVHMEAPDECGHHGDTENKIFSIGEIDQIYNARYHTLNEDAYFETIYRKTASLFVSCVEVGAFAVKASDDDTEKLSKVARLLGLCFQIKDDIFDYFNDEKIGKPTGNDLREGKITLPLLHVLLNESLPQHDEMLALSKKEILDTNEINTLIEYAKQHGGIEYAYDTMQRLRDEAVEIISQFPASQTRDHFIAIIDYIISRDK